MAKLRIEYQGAATEVHLGAASTTLGRSNRCTIALPAPGLADVQFRLEAKGGGFRLKDDGGAESTRVNGKAVFATALRHGDIIEVAGLRCVFLDEAPLAEEPVPASAAAPAPPAQPRTGAVLGIAGGAVAVLAVFFFLLKGSPPGRDAAFLMREAQALLRAAEAEPVSAEPRLRDACALLEELVSDHARSTSAGLANLKLEAARRTLTDLAQVRAEETLVLAADEEREVDETYRRLAALRSRGDPIVSARAAELESALEASWLRKRQEACAEAEGAAAVALQGRRFAEAASVWSALRALGYAFADRAAAGEKEVEEAARKEYRMLLDAAEQAGEIDARLATLEGGRAMFQGTRHAEDLEVRISSLRARRTGPPVVVLEPKKDPVPSTREAETPPPDLPYDDSDEVLALVKARKYGAAAALVQQIQDRSGALVRAEELALLAGVWADVVAAVQARPGDFTEILIRPGVRRDAAGADQEFLRIQVPGGETPYAWETIPAEAFPRLFRIAGLLKPPRLGCALFFDEEKLLDEAQARYVEFFRAGSELTQLHRLLARRRGVPVPEGGFVLHKDQLVTPEEREALLLQESIDKLARDAATVEPKRRAAALDELEKLGAPARAALVAALEAQSRKVGEELTGLKLFTAERAALQLGAELTKRREFALAFILDATAYPYPNPPEGAQEEAERRVAAVREITDNPYPLLLAESPRARELDAELADLDARLERVDPGRDSPGEAVRAAITEAIDMMRAAVSPRDKERIAYNEWVERYNRELTGTSIEEEERANVQAVNDYRWRMGLHCVKIDERLVRASRKHSIEMGQADYFAHESPTPHLLQPGQRARREGYGGGVGENIARGPATGLDAFRGWFKSSGHHRNMVQPGWTEMGCGAYKNHWWTQLFGALTGKSTDPPKIPPDPDPPGSSGNGQPAPG
ncbi:MAG: CAP domain-containing protein [Planctomycetaceae bacterium]